MKITLFVRTYPVKDAPVSLSLVPFPSRERHTYTRDGQVYDAVSREMRVAVPDGSVPTKLPAKVLFVRAPPVSSRDIELIVFFCWFCFRSE